MIVDLILGAALALLRGLLSLIPPWAPSLTALHTAFSKVGAAAMSLNGYFPVVVLAACIGLLVGVRLALMIWHGLVALYQWFPLKAT